MPLAIVKQKDSCLFDVSRCPLGRREVRATKRWMSPLFGSVARVSTTRSEVKNSCDPSLYKLLAKDSFKIMTIDLQGQGSAEGRMPVGDVALSK